MLAITNAAVANSVMVLVVVFIVLPSAIARAARP
jgi:hypothetical protein